MSKFKYGLMACALCLAGGALPVSAQTVVAPIQPEPEAVSLVDRVDYLERELSRLTDENERLKFELQKARADVARLNEAAAEAEPPKPAPVVKAAPAAPAVDSATAYNDAYNYVMNNDHAGAEQALTRFLTTYGASAQAPEARYWLGQVQLAQGKAAPAADQFLNIVKNHPKAPKAPDAYVYLGMAFKQMGKTGEACAVFRDVPVKFPQAPAAVKQRAAQQARSCTA